MKKADFINYQGSKLGIIDFITSGIEEINISSGGVLDLFSGSGVVTSNLLDKFNVVSNDAESYASTICQVFSIDEKITSKQYNDFYDLYNYHKNRLIEQEKLEHSINMEDLALDNKNINDLINVYNKHKTVWNSPSELDSETLKKENKYNLFTRYYAGNYFGIKQAIEIDSIIYSIHNSKYPHKDLFFSSLFYAMKECSYSRDGHMAQPLNLIKNSNRAFVTRMKSIEVCFKQKLEQCISELGNKSKYKHEVYNLDCMQVLNDMSIMNKIDVIYADPPYTDMQYSRYYHLLNIARKYNYPKPTITKNGFTNGLYTEGRFQSELSQKGKAKELLISIVEKAYSLNKSLALSYAYPKEIENQKTDRYTVSIEELINICTTKYGVEQVNVNKINYNHSNNKNKSKKEVIEYLILCSSNPVKNNIDINKIKSELSNIIPTNKSKIYNTHLYWSQKSFNISDYLIKELTDEGEVVFDPFLGSGVTVLEAVKNGNNRSAIGCDINEMPLFITKTICEYSLDKNLINELNHFKKEMKIIDELYKVNCENCNNRISIDKVIFDKPIRNKNDISINAVNIKCTCGCKQFNDLELVLKQMYKEYTYNIVDSKYNLIKNSKIAVLDGDIISNIFTSRNLKALDELLLLSRKYSKNLQRIIVYIINSLLHQAKITDTHSNSQWLLWIPKKNCVEKNVYSLALKKIDLFLKAIKDIEKLYSSTKIVKKHEELGKNKAMLLRMGSQYITEHQIPDNSIDLIITDPPYLEQVLYSEYMQLYKPIVGLSFNLEDEIVVSSAKERKKDKFSYYENLERVFNICGMKLKKDKFMCLYFHDSDLSVWNNLIKSIYNSGFAFMGQSHIKRNVTLKNIISPKKSLNGDSILFFMNTKVKNKYFSGKENIEEIELNVLNEAKYMLKTLGPLSTPELYDNGLMELLIVNGWLEKLSKKYKSLVELFEKSFYWNSYTSKWSL